MKRIVAVIGDYYHPADGIRESLEHALRGAAGVAVADVVYAEAGELAERLEEKPAAVVLFKENRVDPEGDVRMWMTDELEERIVRYVRSGGGWLSWHSGLASYAEDGPLASMLRGCFAYHPDKHKPVVYRREPSVSAEAGGFVPDIGGGDTFELTDEHYFVVCDRSQTNVFLRSESPDGQSIAGWAHSFGAGRVCAVTPAHTPEGLLHPALGALVRSALQWCGRLD